MIRAPNDCKRMMKVVGDVKVAQKAKNADQWHSSVVPMVSGNMLKWNTSILGVKDQLED